MNENIINGRHLAEKILSNLDLQIKVLKQRHNITPFLAVILASNDLASSIYVKNKLKVSKRLNIETALLNLGASATTEKIIEKIGDLNSDEQVSGIIVQLPLPLNVNKDKVLTSIQPQKDVDGFHPLNVGLMHSNFKPSFIPCTALGVMQLIKNCEPNLVGKNAVVIGCSNLVGKPTAQLLLREFCTVTTCHSKTINLERITLDADIIISATGVPNLLTEKHFNKNAIVIDVGINRVKDNITNNNVIVGDVNFLQVYNKVKYITPVPGGVGPMTVAFLMLNTIKAVYMQHNMIDKTSALVL